MLSEELEYKADLELMQKGCHMLAYRDEELDLFRSNLERRKSIDPAKLSYFRSFGDGRSFLQMPILKEANIIRRWAGLYDITPDQQGIVGPTDVGGFFLDAGWSGHGFQPAPAVGRAMAEIVSGEEPKPLGGDLI